MMVESAPKFEHSMAILSLEYFNLRRNRGVVNNLLIAAVVLITGCGSIRLRPKPISIGIDEEFSLVSLNTSCAFKDAQAAKTPQNASRCAESPGLMFQEVRNAFQSAFQENPACEGISLKTYENAGAMTGGVDWRMKLFIRVGDDGVVSVADSSWEIDSHVGSGGSVDGTMGEPYQTATHICMAVKGGGGKVQ